jgi:hypothetical protein
MLIAVATALVSIVNGINPAQADEMPCYTKASLKGTYAVIGTYGANVAIALAVRHFDGHGNLKGTFTLNEPEPTSTTGGRKIVTGTQIGTYTVNCDGSGVITRTLTTSTGIVTVQEDDFIITEAKVGNEDSDVLIATALEDAQRTPSAIVAGGIFLTRSYTRRPD